MFKPGRQNNFIVIAASQFLQLQAPNRNLTCYKFFLTFNTG